MDDENKRYIGRDNAGVEHLLTVFPDGHAELASRPVGSASWLAPVQLEAVQ